MKRLLAGRRKSVNRRLTSAIELGLEKCDGDCRRRSLAGAATGRSLHHEAEPSLGRVGVKDVVALDT